MSIRTKLVYDRAAIIDKSLHRLERLSELSLEEFAQNPDNYAIAEHYLRIGLEALFDIGRHILVKSGFGKPEDYRDILILLGRYGIIPQEFMDRVKGMAGYRNRLVHMYNEVDVDELFGIICNHRKDIKEFASYLIDYVKKAEPGL